jgi:hypothetical protein
MSFLYSLNRLNVATSRAKCLSILVWSPALFEPGCRTCDRMSQRRRGRFGPRSREADRSRASGPPVPREGMSPNSPAIGEQQMKMETAICRYLEMAERM